MLSTPHGFHSLIYLHVKLFKKVFQKVYEAAPWKVLNYFWACCVGFSSHAHNTRVCQGGCFYGDHGSAYFDDRTDTFGSIKPQVDHFPSEDQKPGCESNNNLTQKLQAQAQFYCCYKTLARHVNEFSFVSVVWFMDFAPSARCLRFQNTHVQVTGG